MTAQSADYLASTVPDDERLQNLLALGTGVQTTVAFLLSRLARYHDLLELEIEDSPGAMLYLKEANASLHRATDFVNAYRDLLQATTADHESFDLVLLVRGMASRLDKLGTAKVTVNTDALESPEAFIRGSLYLLQQVLFALPRAVIHSTDGPTALTLQITHERFDQSFLATRKSGLSSGDYYAVTLSWAEVEVDRNRWCALNERMVQAEPTGLEHLLFISGVVSNHGGELFALKGEGPLDSLALILPAEQNAAAMYTEPGKDDDSLRGTETILLVDDEAIIWDVVIDMLQSMGYTVVLAADGRDCVDIYQENPGEIDLVLLDMVMPEMNGKEAFFALKKIDPEVVVLLQSGYIDEDDARDVLDAGARGFLRKPYRMRELARKIRTVLNSGTPARNPERG